MRRKLIAGNWKMHGCQELCKGLLLDILKEMPKDDSIDWLVCPPDPYLLFCAQLLDGSPIKCGAQNVSEYIEPGAFTGEVSASMLKDVDCAFTIVGHSERRTLFFETNEQVARKSLAAFKAGVMPIVCVGETLAEREAGLTLNVVKEQLEVLLALEDNCPEFSRAVIAYEPVWAIGTGQSATADQVQFVHHAIRSLIAEKNTRAAQEMRIIYGGSVKPSNAAELLKLPDVDGALIGGASLQAEQFTEIGKLCSN